MHKELVYIHRRTDRRDCATITVQALIPHLISPKSVDALLENVFRLRDAASVVAEELAEYGLKTVLIQKSEQIPASRFFKKVAHTLQHGKHSGFFVGGIIAVELPDQDVNHMVAITSLHEKGKRKKVTIVDSGPRKISSQLVRKVPLEWLDRNLMKSGGLGITAVAFIAMPSEKPPENCKDNRDMLIERKFSDKRRVFTYNPTEDHISIKNMEHFSKKRLKREERMKYA